MRLTALAALTLAVPALASAQPYTFVSTPASDSLAMIDLSTDTVVASVPLSGLPTGSAQGGAGKRVYAALSQSNALAIVDVATGAVRTVQVSAGPTGVAVARRRVYVANTGADTVSVVDPGPAAVVATIPVGDGPSALVAGERRLYVANWDGGTVSVIDTTTNSVIATIPVGTFPAGLALHAATRRLYVANFLDDTVSVIDTQALSVASTFPVARGPRGLAVDAAGQRLFVAGFDDARIQAIDTGTGAVALEAASGGLNPLDVMLDARGSRLYVAHLQETQGVVALDAATLAPVASVDVPAGPVGFSGLARRRPRAPLATGWPRAARALAGVVRVAAAAALAPRLDVVPSADSDVVISDTQFALEDWAVAGSESGVSQEPAGGNPGAWRRITHFGQGTTVHRLIRPGSQYNPSTQGPVVELDVSWDRRLFAETIISERFLVEQDDIIYWTTERSFFSPTWQADTRTRLVADDFSDLGGAHPDFSGTGSALGFGFVRRSFNGTVPHGIDNFVVTVRRAVPPDNLLRFQKTIEVMEETDSLFVWVDRQFGTQGVVTVDVLTERPNGTTITETLTWADGDSFPKNILLVSVGLPDGAGARTARLRLLNPTGGATIDPSRDQMAVTVYPREWPPVILALFLRLKALFGAFTPVWLLVLAVPAMAMTARRVRRRRAVHGRSRQ